MELTRFLSEFSEKLKEVNFPAKDVWDCAVLVRLAPEKAANALIDFCLKNPQVDLDLYREGKQVINRFWLLPPGPEIYNLGPMGPSKFFKFMFALGIEIE